MSRLTKRIDNNEYVVENYICLNEPWKTPISKLGELEDIEDTIGIDLITLFKALKDGIYVKFGNKKITETECYIHSYILPRNIYKDEKGWVIDLRIELSMNHCLYLKDYNKTWSLTKGELENDK